MPAMNDYGGIGGGGGDQQQPEQYLSQYEPIPLNGAGNLADGGTTTSTAVADAASPVLSAGGGLMLNLPQIPSDISSLTLEQQQQLLCQLQEQQRLLEQQLDREAQEQLSQQQQGGTAQSQSQHLPAAMGGTAGIPAHDLSSVHTPTLSSSAHSSGGGLTPASASTSAETTPQMHPQMANQMNNGNNTMWPNAATSSGANLAASGLNPEQQQQVQQQLQLSLIHI